MTWRNMADVRVYTGDIEAAEREQNRLRARRAPFKLPEIEGDDGHFLTWAELYELGYDVPPPPGRRAP